LILKCLTFVVFLVMPLNYAKLFFLLSFSFFLCTFCGGTSGRFLLLKLTTIETWLVHFWFHLWNVHFCLFIMLTAICLADKDLHCHDQCRVFMDVNLQYLYMQSVPISHNCSCIIFIFNVRSIPTSGKMYMIQLCVIIFVMTCGMFVVTWFSENPFASYTNKTDHHNIIKILFKVALNTNDWRTSHAVKKWENWDESV
jgi:hypothetical protein